MPRIFSAMKSHHCGVGRLVEQQVRVVAGQLGEAAGCPHLLVERAPLVLGVVEGGAVVRRVQEAGRRGVERLADRLEVGPQPRLLVGGDRRVVQRRAPVGGALVDRQRRGLARRSTGTSCTPLDPVPTTATRLPAKSTGAAGQRPVWCCSPRKSLAAGYVGEVAAPTARPSRRSGTRARTCGAVAWSRPSSVPDASSYSAEVTRAPKRMWRRRSNRSTTWFR